jgi:hypothetical protein
MSVVRITAEKSKSRNCPSVPKSENPMTGLAIGTAAPPIVVGRIGRILERHRHSAELLQGAAGTHDRYAPIAERELPAALSHRLLDGLHQSGEARDIQMDEQLASALRRLRHERDPFRDFRISEPVRK